MPSSDPSTPPLVPATPPPTSRLTPRKGTAAATPSPSPSGDGHNCSKNNSDGFRTPTSGGRRKRGGGGIFPTSNGGNMTYPLILTAALVLLAHSPAFNSMLRLSGSHPSLSCILSQVDVPASTGNHTTEVESSFEPSTKQIKSGKFCVPWTVDLDRWHQHAVEW